MYSSQNVLLATAKGFGGVLGGHTYRGKPLSVATATATADALERDYVIAKSALNASYLKERLLSLQTRHPLIKASED